jgi:transposase
MGRLSTFAKNRILNLRFQKSYRIKQIALTLLSEDNIKVSRKSISTFLKKYIETKSIHDKPRSGRNKKLTPEEINLIGEVTRLNRDITAPKIKEYLNLNVSTYTILRASKLFEWNKLNPNSNEAKKAAALERQLNGETKKRKANKKAETMGATSVGKKSKKIKLNRKDQSENHDDDEENGDEEEKENETFRDTNEKNKVKLIGKIHVLIRSSFYDL